MNWRGVVLGVVAMLKHRRSNVSPMKHYNEIELAKQEGMKLVYSWIADELTYLATRPPHEALGEVRRWIKAARDAGIELHQETP